MKSLFKSASTNYIGVDISASHVKMMELSGSRNSITVERYAITSIPEGVYTDNIVSDPDKLGEAMHQCWLKLNTRNRNIALAMPSAHITSKQIQVPTGLGERELIEQVENEVANFVPVPRDEINLDFQVVGPSTKEGFDEVFVAVTKRQNVEMLLNAAAAAELTPRVLEIEHNTVMHALNEMLAEFDNHGADSNFMVVDIGSDHSNYLVYRNQELLHARDVNTAGAGLTHSIQSMYGINQAEALALMSNPEAYSAKFPDYSTAVLQPFLDGQAMELARQIQYFEQSGNPGVINHIILAGGLASTEGLDETIRARIAANVVIANPMATCQLATRVEPQKLLNDAPRLMVCFGLALRSFV